MRWMSTRRPDFLAPIEDRYLAYSFGDKLTHRELLRATLELLPELSADWSQITAFRARAAEHPFDFKPFHPISERDVKRVLPYANKRIAAYRADIWPVVTSPSPMGRFLGDWQAPGGAATPVEIGAGEPTLGHESLSSRRSRPRAGEPARVAELPIARGHSLMRPISSRVLGWPSSRPK